MTTETPAILLTTADIENIEKERAQLDAEVAMLVKKHAELDQRRTELSERLAKIHTLLDALGLGTLGQLSSNSLYAARNVKSVPRNGVIS
ncbi:MULTISPECIES: hypothetical protein [Asticcacaulis]|uniref:hypothetical protein n=1 Tax=Asticcacaulis TaxID=76890 RepID=UPI001AEA1945|nr:MULTISPECIES: hypothetical protein [Asticcacaulis]MBP2159470.1 prefoldin subunit 5 [Asticcacaulis solisilvae]MDR6800703.1 prefoldin subunit 5 [Asticcacaulis sp. BE141]